jgi:hypothetical protein
VCRGWKNQSDNHCAWRIEYRRVDLLISVDPENEARVLSALATLPENAVRALQVGEVQRYSVVRVADEIVVPNAVRNRQTFKIRNLR